ncbi:hypothetical protein H6P81_010451 [Aristolochia fimbriata]|uniref:Uncharacterized protein n=1 Tax=Aristolochia fimbriata TaxID=158543 RepID=A0AAV7EPY0_ARIFI|nr:hypothetical protein H6P81_010451 [Aristolochia fimbriata]
MTTVTELKELIHSWAGIDSNKYGIALFYRCTLDSPNITPISIIDDVDLEQVFALTLNESSKVPSLYVVKSNKSSSPRTVRPNMKSMSSEHIDVNEFGQQVNEDDIAINIDSNQSEDDMTINIEYDQYLSEQSLDDLGSDRDSDVDVPPLPAFRDIENDQDEQDRDEQPMVGLLEYVDLERPPQFQIGMFFKNISDFSDALEDESIQQKFNF